MTGNGKRLLALLLALLLCVALLPAAALAEEDEEPGTIALVEEPEEPIEDAAPEDPEALPPADEPEEVYSGSCGDDLTWTLNTDTGVLTISGTRDMWDWTYQEPGPWYDSRASITSVELPDGLTSIGGYAFYNCSGLTSVTLPEGLTSIRYYAFYNCSGLTRVTLPASLTSIGYYAFYGCSGLTDVSYAGTMEQWRAISIEDGNAPVQGGIIRCSDGRIDNSSKCGDDLTWTLTDDGVLTITGSGTMWSAPMPWENMTKQIRKVVIESGVTSVSGSSFYGCSNLVEVSLPESLTILEPFSFRECPGLTTVDLPASLEYYGQGAFSECPNLLAINIAEGGNFVSVNGVLFTADMKTLVAFPNGMRGEDGVYRVPEGVTTLFHRAFYGSLHLTQIILPDSVSEFGNNEFQFCSKLEAVNIPYGVDTLYISTFYSTNLKSIVIPASVTTIWEWAFANCGELKTIKFAGSAPSFGQTTFSGVTATAYYPENDETWTEDVRQNYGGNITWVAYISIPEVIASGQCGDDLTWTLTDDGVLTISGTGDMWNWSWTSAAPWHGHCDYITSVDLPEGLTGIGNWAFERCVKLESVTIPEGVTRIGENAFAWCIVLTSVTLPGSVTSIGDDAFSDCYILESVTLPEGLTSIGAWAFQSCRALTSVTLPEGLTGIGAWAFQNCGGLTSVTLPASVTDIGSGAFSDCSSLTAIEVAEENENFSSSDGILYNKEQTALIQCPGGKTDALELPEGVTSIENAAFSGCGGLTSVTLPEGLTRIGSSAFSGCGSLTSVTIPVSVTDIGNHAFFWCSSLESVELPAGLTEIRDNTFNNCSSLTSVTLPEGLTRIGSAAFYKCSSLTSVTLPAGVTEIGWTAFENCSSLKKLVFLGSAPTIRDYTFKDVTADAWYPAADETWTEEVRQDYGGDLTWIPCRDGKPVNSFADVPEGKYYYDPVLWAYYHDPQITGGTSETTFSPNKTCTREQIVTFLWKACGAPEPETTTNPFTDVPESKYYYKAVLWAVENGITGGVSADKFGVGRPCTREQAMTFLWKACGSPAPENSSNPFTDVPEGKYYYNAVLWAVEKGITGGVSATAFGVSKPCTRGQIVTFLYAARSFLRA